MLPQRGFAPLSLDNAKTQSVGLAYMVFACHCPKWSARAGCIATGALRLAFLQLPISLTQLRRTMIRFHAYSTSAHCRASASLMLNPVTAMSSVRINSGSSSWLRIDRVCSGVQVIAS